MIGTVFRHASPHTAGPGFAVRCIALHTKGPLDIRINYTTMSSETARDSATHITPEVRWTYKTAGLRDATYSNALHITPKARWAYESTTQCVVKRCHALLDIAHQRSVGHYFYWEKLMQEVKISELVLDFDLYPRPSIDSEHVKGMIDAEKTGVKFPPILADKKSKRITDGFHRYRMRQRVYGEDATIEVVLKSYKNEADMIEDAIRLNTQHGKKLSPFDHARCLLIARRVKLSDDRLASALHVPMTKLSDLRTRKIATTNGTEVPIKVTIAHMAGKTLTRKQAAVVPKLGGMRQLFYVNQVTTLIETDLIDTSNEKLMAGLKRLGQLIRKM